MKYILLSFVLLFTNIFVSFVLVNRCIENRGIAFGIEVGYVSILSFLFLVAILILSLRIKSSLKYIFLGIVILGSGNLLERVIRGYICDYIPFFNLSINMLDIGIVVLTILGILICILKKDEDTDK